ncbi:MAG: glycosyltransferase family 4 protein [Planctomycetota bacterium]
MRIAMLTFAVPWEERPTNGLYNIAQARALTSLGATTEVFSVAPKLPRVFGKLGGAVQRQLARPDTYEFEGVRVHTVRAPAAFPKQIRERIAPLWPDAVSRTFRHLTNGPLAAALDRFTPDALLVHGMQPWGDFVTDYARKHGTRIVFIEHSQGDVMSITDGSAMHRFVERIGSSADSTFAVNAQMSERLEQLDVPRVLQVTNGVNTLADPPRRETAGEKPFRVLCAGAYYARKGHRELLDGFARAGLVDAELVLVGEPPRSIRQEISLRGLSDRVRWLPLLPNEALLEEMARADLFALPSWSEAFGLVFMESLGVGTPVLMTHDCGAARHIRHGEHGWIVPPRDPGAIALALQAAFRMPTEELRAMGQTGRRLVHQRFTWQQNAEVVLRTLGERRERPMPMGGPQRAEALAS